jgi:hypothetical protein
MASVRNNVHVVSQVQFHHKLPKDTTGWRKSTAEEKEHVTVLDGLALLIVFKPKSDVAAVTVWQTASEIQLFWAKNQPVKDSNELRYIESLLQMAKAGTSGDELLTFVLEMCKEKIFHRIAKLAKAFGDQPENTSNLWGFNEENPNHEKFQDKMKTCIFFQDRTTVETLDSFMRSVRSMTKHSAAGHFESILYFCWFVTYDLECDKILGSMLDEKKVRSLKKIGDYMRTCRHIHKLMTTKFAGMSLKVEQVLISSIFPI